jgi:hypothetical protein
VFLPYSEATYEKTQGWLQERNLFEEPPAALVKSLRSTVGECEIVPACLKLGHYAHAA